MTTHPTEPDSRGKGTVTSATSVRIRGHFALNVSNIRSEWSTAKTS